MSDSKLLPTETFAEGNILICVFPSSRSNGVYLVQVKPYQHDLVITHECPACRYKRQQHMCKHVTAALEAYKRWQCQEPYKRVHTVTQKIVLDPAWEQVQLSLSPIERILDVIADAT